jgi:glyoxylate reductase
MRVLASRRLPGPAFDELPDVELLEAPLPDGLRGERPDVEALAVVHEWVDERSLALLPSVRIVASYGVGCDEIDVAACSARGITVTNTPGVLDAATADLAFALILAARRRVIEGIGGVGRAVARRARAFDMRVLYATRRRLRADEESALGVEYRELDELLGEADIVSLHVPLTRQTPQLIDARRLTRSRGDRRRAGCDRRAPSRPNPRRP